MGIITKSDKQIKGIRKSCQVAADTLRHIAPFVKSGATTASINHEAEQFMWSKGARPAPLGYHGYPKATCISINDVICHGIPNETILQDGDIVNVDVTTIINGYYGDTSCMFMIGEVSEEAKKLVEETKKCMEMGIAVCRQGVGFWEIGKAIQAHADLHGYGVVHQFCGHGVGIKFHEEPQVFHYWREGVGDKRLMQAGHIFTIEPMINQGVAEAKVDPVDKWTARTVDGKLSAQWEHTVLVTPTGVEVLTL